MFNMFKFVFVIYVIFVLQCKNVASSESFHTPNFTSMREIVKKMPQTQCIHDLNTFVNALEKSEIWALKMFDASVKFPFGLKYGNYYHLGNFDECIEAGNTHNSQILDTENVTFSGQYCLAELSDQQFGSNLTEQENFTNRKSKHLGKNTIYWAACVPSSCLPNEIESLLQSILNGTLPMMPKPLKFKLPPNSCYFKEDFHITTGQILFCVAMGLFLFFVIFATVFHCVHIYRKQHLTAYTLNAACAQNSTHEAVMAFSIIKNIKKLMEFKAKNSNNLDCICGIRAISMFFILAGHALIFLISAPSINANFHVEAVQKLQNAMFINNPLLVDTFLLVSGFLMCRLLLIELEKRAGKINICLLYIGRYIRLTPAYAVIIAFYCTFFMHIGNGPLWKDRMTKEQDRCLNSWWANVLYINNYVNTDNLCMFQAWYLSVDTQLFFLAPLFVYPLWYKRVIGEVILCVACIATGLIPFMITCSKHLDPTLMIYSSEINDLSTNYYFKNFYIKTHMRANAYLMGLACGYAVHRIQQQNYKIPFVARILIGVVAIIAGVGSMFSIVIYYQPDYVYNPFEVSIYAASHRVAWCFAIGWTLIVCVTSNSYVNNFLSWGGWAPFSKLTYCAYLVNGIVELYSYSETRIPRYLSTYNLACETSAHIVMTFALAFILCVLFESPIHNLEKVLLHGHGPKAINTQVNGNIGKKSDTNSNLTLAIETSTKNS